MLSNACAANESWKAYLFSGTGGNGRSYATAVNATGQIAGVRYYAAQLRATILEPYRCDYLDLTVSRARRRVMAILIALVCLVGVRHMLYGKVFKQA